MKSLLRVLRVLSPIVCSLTTCLLVISTLLAQPTGPRRDDVSLERDADNGQVVIRIPARDGKVAWEDVLRALLRAGYLDDDALKDKFPAGTLDLARAYSRYSLMAVNLAMAPDIRMAIVEKTKDKPAYLQVVINEARILERKRRLSNEIRERITGGEPRRGTFGLRLKDGPGNSDPQRPLIIIVHGFNSSPERFEPLAQALRGKGFLSATYSYPDDQPIVDSARQLSVDLKDHARQYPGRPITLITHSMGGLVARRALEDPELDPGTVTRLIMVAPPNGGSLLAHFAFGIDILDHVAGDSTTEDVTRLYAAVEDGLSEARDDLKPGSPFLKALNARPRNSNAKYSIFLGTGGHLKRDQVERLRALLRSGSERSTAVGLISPHLDETLADLDEVVRGQGDGVVAVKRGRLEGVEDVFLADFTHLGVLQAPGSFEQDPVFKALLRRLRD